MPTTALPPEESTLPGRHFTELRCAPPILTMRVIVAVFTASIVLGVYWVSVHPPRAGEAAARLASVAIAFFIAALVAFALYDRFARRRLLQVVHAPADLAAYYRRYAFPALLLDSEDSWQQAAVALRWRFRGETIVLSRRLHFTALAPLDEHFEPRRLCDLAEMFPPPDAGSRPPVRPRLAAAAWLTALCGALIFAAFGWRRMSQIAAIGVVAIFSAQAWRQARRLMQPIVYDANLHAASAAVIQPRGAVVQREAAFCLAVEVERLNWFVVIAWPTRALRFTPNRRPSRLFCGSG